MVNDLGHYIHRELLITNDRTFETRVVLHLQYVEWPDHGAPLSTTQFLEYVRHVQRLNINMADAEEEGNITLVHCSAGIGRTGAFILLDAALHLLDTDFPVNPIQLIKLMRDQRPMMLQTSVCSLLLPNCYCCYVFPILSRYNSSSSASVSSTV